MWTCLLTLVRLQHGWTCGKWGVSENNRRARFYRIMRAGERPLVAESPFSPIERIFLNPVESAVEQRQFAVIEQAQSHVDSVAVELAVQRHRLWIAAVEREWRFQA